MKLKNKRQINLIISLILALLAVIFVVLNTKLVEINFGLFSFKLPLIYCLSGDDYHRCFARLFFRT